MLTWLILMLSMVIVSSSQYDHLRTESSSLISWSIIALFIYVCYKVWSDIDYWHSFAKLCIHSCIKKLPVAQRKIAEKTAKVRVQFENELIMSNKHFQVKNEQISLPKSGMSSEETLSKVRRYLNQGRFDFHDGSQSGTVYVDNPELNELMTEVFRESMWTNPLHPDTFPGIRQMEAEVVSMVGELFNTGRGESLIRQICGCMTSGGTESITLACKAYRDRVLSIKWSANPVIIAPRTAHAAFEKAANLLGISIKHVAVDEKTGQVNMKAYEKVIKKTRVNYDIVMLVGSAPQFAHGSIDDIQSIATLALKYSIPLHVDACLGGFILPFMNQHHYTIPPFDFSVCGVTSISVDTHKYGFAPKGSSVLLYKSPEYRKYQYFSVSEWPGGLYATSTISGSRTGNVVATTWASLVYHGLDGYMEAAKAIVDTCKWIGKKLREEVREVEILGSTDVCVVAFTSHVFNIYEFADLLKERGNWNLNLLQFPSCIHLCVTKIHTREGVASRFVDDVKHVANRLSEDKTRVDTADNSDDGGSAAIYGMSQTIGDRSLVDELSCIYLDTLLSTRDSIAKRRRNDNLK